MVVVVFVGYLNEKSLEEEEKEIQKQKFRSRSSSERERDLLGRLRAKNMEK
jgi:hypothetical protein